MEHNIDAVNKQTVNNKLHQKYTALRDILIQYPKCKNTIADRSTRQFEIVIQLD